MRAGQSVLFLFFIHLSTPSNVTWMKNAVFNSPENFESGKIPCSKETVLFSDYLQAPIKISGNVSINEIILPNDGEFFLDDVLIQLGEDPEEKCEGNRIVKFKDISYNSWEDPDVWYSEKFNEATPDAERVPCHEDTVVIPEIRYDQTSIDLPRVTQYIKKMIFNNYEISYKTRFLVINNRYNGIFVGGDDARTLSFVDTKCLSKAGCPCQINMPQINCYKKICQEPKCLNPIQPPGHCCKICGGGIIFETTPSFNMATFTENIEDIINSYGSDVLAYHVAKLPETLETLDENMEGNEVKTIFNDNSGKVQVIIVEKGDYTGISTEAINKLYHSMSKLDTKSLSLSGYPIDKVGLGWKVFISMFFVAVAVMGSIYVYYYRVPDYWVRNLSLNLMPGRPVLSRFQRRTDSVLSLARRDSAVSRTSAGGFRNPLYDSKRGRVVVTESVEEEE
ncbi:protein amnionless [Plodia interpunctella]|uniref:protein amnionless n=1 Tax=Plodia interpunctella TaxID=58824 RepID=UPI0023675059|nr:protein amnionless [Plodia interpunctella]